MQKAVINILTVLSLVCFHSSDSKSTNLTNCEYIQPVFPVISPDTKYLSYYNSQVLYLTKIRGFKTHKLKFEEGIQYYRFSPDGKYLLVKTQAHIYRYSLKNKPKFCDSVYFEKQCFSSINNTGDVVVLTSPNFYNKKSKLIVWWFGNDKLSLIENDLGYIDPGFPKFNHLNQNIIFDSEYTYDYPTWEKRKTVNYHILTIAGDSIKSKIILDEIDPNYLKGHFYYPYKKDKILYHEYDQQNLLVYDSLFNISETIPYEKLRITDDIVKIAFSPSNKFMAIHWSVWDGDIGTYYMSLINSETYTLIYQTTIKESMMYSQTFAVSDAGKIYFSHYYKKTNQFFLFKLSEDKAKRIRKINVRFKPAFTDHIEDSEDTSQ